MTRCSLLILAVAGILLTGIEGELLAQAPPPGNGTAGGYAAGGMPPAGSRREECQRACGREGCPGECQRACRRWVHIRGWRPGAAGPGAAAPVAADRRRTCAAPSVGGWSGPGFYFSLWKILLFWIVFVLWVHTTDWVSSDAAGIPDRLSPLESDRLRRLPSRQCGSVGHPVLLGQFPALVYRLGGPAGQRILPFAIRGCKSMNG